VTPIKKYPYISYLIIFSIVWILIGIYVAFVLLVVKRESKLRTTDDNQREITTEKRSTKLADFPTSEVPTDTNPIFKQYKTAKSFYDSQTNVTTSQSEYLPNRKIVSAEFSMVAYFKEYGKKVSTPENISLRLALISEEDSFSKDLTFKIFLDGKAVFSKNSQFEYAEEAELEKPEMDGVKYGKKSEEEDKPDKTSTVQNAKYTALIQEIPYELFIKICESKKVRLQVGQTQFNLNKSDLDSFRDLQKLINAQEKMIVN